MGDTFEKLEYIKIDVLEMALHSMTLCILTQVGNLRILWKAIYEVFKNRYNFFEERDKIAR